MSATTTTVIRCDRPGCLESLAAESRETDLELRIRASRDHGWRFFSSFRQGGHDDYCGRHA